MNLTSTYSQREFAGQPSSHAAEGAEYAPFVEHVRATTKRNIASPTNSFGGEISAIGRGRRAPRSHRRRTMVGPTISYGRSPTPAWSLRNTPHRSTHAVAGDRFLF